MPIHTVLLTGLTKFDGYKQRRLRSREFHQIAGRAGRSGFDTEGVVIAEAPEFEIENHKAELKAMGDPKKMKKLKKKRPPEGFVTWNEDTFTRLIESEPETLKPRLRITPVSYTHLDVYKRQAVHMDLANHRLTGYDGQAPASRAGRLGFKAHLAGSGKRAHILLVRQRQAQETRDTVFGRHPLQEVLARVRCPIRDVLHAQLIDRNFARGDLAKTNLLDAAHIPLRTQAVLDELAKVRLLVPRHDVVR